jgi:hypothetical protein
MSSPCDDPSSGTLRVVLPPIPCQTTFVPETPPMDTRFFDIEDSADEIYDIEDLQEDDDEEQSFTQMLNSNYTF